MPANFSSKKLIVLIFSLTVSFATFLNTPDAEASCPHSSSGLLLISSAITAVNIYGHTATANQARKTLHEVLGACALPSPTMPACKLPTQQFTTTNTNLYDGLARPTVDRIYRSVGNQLKVLYVVPMDGPPRPMNYDDFVAVDALARTIFAEMRSQNCAKKPYSEAVARTIINRAHDPNPRKFQAQDVRGNAITKSILRDQQYSVWNNDDEIVSSAQAKKRSCDDGKTPEKLESHLENTRLALCPGAPDATALNKEAWEKSVEIAMRAVLNERDFMKATASLGPLEYYTSNIKGNRRDGFRNAATPRLEGKTLGDWYCMKFWKED